MIDSTVGCVLVSVLAGRIRRGVIFRGKKLRDRVSKPAVFSLFPHSNEPSRLLLVMDLRDLYQEEAERGADLPGALTEVFHV